MQEAARDRWASWMLRFDDDLESMHPVRDRVLAGARLGAGDVLLDVGTGSGLIALGALPLVGRDGRVIFSDVSEELLDHCRRVVSGSSPDDRCRFVVASADNLAQIPDASVNAVTTRSVLIYVKDKAKALREFFRVLRTGGRVSLFEPVNSFGHPEPADRLLGYDLAAVADLAAKVKAAYERIQPPDDPLLDFDERDLVRHAEDAGFGDILMTLEVRVDRRPWTGELSWEAFLRAAGNPRLPPCDEVLREALTPVERKRFLRHLHPLVERGDGEGRLALAYLRAVKA